MSNAEDPTPQWVVSLRTNIEQARQEWDLIRDAGQADVRRGLETIQIAEQRLQEIDYLQRTFSQNLPPPTWNDEIVHTTGVQIVVSAGIFQQHSQNLQNLYTSFDQQRQVQQQHLISAVNNIAVSSGSLIYMGAQIERRIEAILPTYTLVLATTQLSQIGSRQQTYDELANSLQVFDPKYLHMLKGSEATLHSTSADSLSQAAHSMRDLFQQIIEHLAPAEAVKQQPWFKATPGAPGGVSRMSRLRYILYGAGSMLSEGEIEQLDEAAERAKKALDLSIARAHDHDPELTQAEVQLAIDHARFSLLQVLKRYVTHRGWGTA